MVLNLLFKEILIEIIDISKNENFYLKSRFKIVKFSNFETYLTNF